MEVSLSSDDHGYFGHKVTSLFVTSIPLLFNTSNLDDWIDRVVLACCGALGSCLAIVADKPNSWQETAGRIAAGFIACAMFIPYIAKRYNFSDQIDSLIAASALFGIISWYLCGSSVRFLQWIKTSGIFSNIAMSLLKMNSNAQGVLPKWPPDMPVTPPPAPIVNPVVVALPPIPAAASGPAPHNTMPTGTITTVVVLPQATEDKK